MTHILQKNAKILSKIKFNETPSEIFINKDKLVVFTQEYDYNSHQEYYYGSQMKTSISIYDISDRKKSENRARNKVRRTIL
ncbi:hypothetical protein MSIBF_A4650004 [groundwater metagenome]|uniref:Uncharacterized protein n=1 Tax=groundwater metagenome TaxID=717931 RepID=A0A098EE23_9ZZZZ